jgi:hypothetical protein
MYPVELTNDYFQQDSTTAGTARTTMKYLEEFFPGPGVGRTGIEDVIANFEPEMLANVLTNLK